MEQTNENLQSQKDGFDQQDDMKKNADNMGDTAIRNCSIDETSNPDKSIADEALTAAETENRNAEAQRARNEKSAEQTPEEKLEALTERNEKPKEKLDSPPATSEKSIEQAWRGKLDAFEIDELVNLSKDHVLDRLGISARHKPAIAAFVSKELKKMLQESTEIERIDKIVGGLLEKSFKRKTPTQLDITVAAGIVQRICVIYGLNFEGNKALYRYFDRLVSYFSGMIACKFTTKWLGRRLYDPDFNDE